MQIIINVSGGRGCGKSWLVNEFRKIITAAHRKATVTEHRDGTDKDGIPYEHIEFNTWPVTDNIEIDRLVAGITEENRHDEI